MKQIITIEVTIDNDELQSVMKADHAMKSLHVAAALSNCFGHLLEQLRRAYPNESERDRAATEITIGQLMQLNHPNPMAEEMAEAKNRTMRKV